MGTQKGENRLASYLVHRPALVSYVTPIAGSREDAEDIVQEVFLRFQRTNALITGSTRAYLYKVAYNLAIDCTRRKKRETRLHTDDLPAWTRPQGLATPETKLLLEDEVRRISAYLDDCPEETRQVLEMYRFGGLTMAQISERLGISVSSVHRILRKTMVALADLMERDV